MNDAELIEMARKCGVKGIDEAHLVGQTQAYGYCCDFVSSLEKRKTINTQHGSYSLKHMVENPSGYFDVPKDGRFSTVYVYEGTFILAAISHGFDWKQMESRMNVVFNVSEKSLKETIRRLTSR
jgi:hypothetical protein